MTSSYVFDVFQKDDHTKSMYYTLTIMKRVIFSLEKTVPITYFFVFLGVMFDLPRKMKNYAIKKFLSDNPKGRDYLNFWETEEEIDIRFRNLYQQFQYALIERNYEMEQQLYELACPHGYTQMMLDLNTTFSSREMLSVEEEEKRLRAHARRYLRKKLHAAAMLSTTTAEPYDMRDAVRKMVETPCSDSEVDV